MASSKPHPADRHDLIRVQGARENNLKDVTVELPKRRLTVFTGVSGSGKSSLVFGTIAAESQRLINETYSAFVQGFMPSMARPEVDVLEGLTTAILVDQERMGANARSTVGTVTDANAMLRVLFSRLGKPYVGPSNAFSFNVPTVRGAGKLTVEKAGKKTETKTFTVNGGMCSRCDAHRQAPGGLRRRLSRRIGPPRQASSAVRSAGPHAETRQRRTPSTAASSSSVSGPASAMRSSRRCGMTIDTSRPERSASATRHARRASTRSSVACDRRGRSFRGFTGSSLSGRSRPRSIASSTRSASRAARG